MLARAIWLVLVTVVLSIAADRPYVLLLSIDGFRYDYAERHDAKNLLAFARSGVAAKALIPCFPTSTFPNHYSIVTGLYPSHHGLIENHFFDPKSGGEFHYNLEDSKAQTEFWKAPTLWNLAEQQGIRTAAFFWPGSDVVIQRGRPSIYRPWDSNVRAADQVDEVLKWMRLPAGQRPHFIALYFSEVDRASHPHGPDSPETAEAIRQVDEAFGKLVAGIRKTELPVNIFVVSDHGMVSVKHEAVMDTYVPDAMGVRVLASTTDVKFYSPDRARLERLHSQLKGKSGDWEVYWPDEIPAELHHRADGLEGDLVVLAVKPVVLMKHSSKNPPKGMHGYPVSLVPEMRGIFYAAGPQLKRGLKIDEFENVHIFPFLAKLLGVNIPKVDGDVKVLAPILR